MRDLRADAVSLAAFREALHDLAEAPTPANVRRYLAASRKLDDGAPKAGRAKRSRQRIAKESPA
jgi:hypothetical protein